MQCREVGLSHDGGVTWQGVGVVEAGEVGRGHVGGRVGDAGPAGEQRDDAAWWDVGVAECLEAGVAVAFGEASAVLAQDQGEVVIPRQGREAQGVVEQHLPRGGGEQVIAADDIGDALRGIVDDDSQLVGGQALLGGDDEVADFA